MANKNLPEEDKKVLKWTIAVLVFAMAMMTTGMPGWFEAKKIAAGPVCFPGGPCGSGKVTIAFDPVCFPGGRCGSGGGIVTPDPLLFPGTGWWT